MTDERMSVEEALENLKRGTPRCGSPYYLRLRAYVADTQEIVRLAREVVEECEDGNDCVSGSPLMHAIHALRDRLEKLDA